MNCWHCGSELIRGGDHTFEDYCMDTSDGIVSNFSCSSCPASVLVFLPFEDEAEQAPVEVSTDANVEETSPPE